MKKEPFKRRWYAVHFKRADSWRSQQTRAGPSRQRPRRQAGSRGAVRRAGGGTLGFQLRGDYREAALSGHERPPIPSWSAVWQSFGLRLKMLKAQPFTVRCYIYSKDIEDKWLLTSSFSGSHLKPRRQMSFKLRARTSFSPP